MVPRCGGVHVLTAGIAAFLADQAASGVRPPTLSRRVAAIDYAHDLTGMA